MVITIDDNNNDNVFTCLMAIRSTVYGRPCTAIPTSSSCVIYAACKNDWHRSVLLAKAATPLSFCFRWMHIPSIRHRWLATPTVPLLTVGAPHQPVH